MSYHILHQFDEQWLADLTQEVGAGNKRRSLLNAADDESRQPSRRARLAARESRRWAIVAASILLAAFALLFSIDTSRRAETLQKRLDTLEATIKK